MLLFVLAMAGCTESATTQQMITADQVEKMVQEDKNVQLVDVRTPQEIRQTGRINGAQAIDYSSPDFQQKIAALNRSKPVIVYCAAGGRSPRAAALMVQMGFSTIYDYAGGMNDWKSKGKPTVP